MRVQSKVEAWPASGCRADSHEAASGARALGRIAGRAVPAAAARGRWAQAASEDGGATWHAVALTVCRDGTVLELAVRPAWEDGLGTPLLVHWAGALVQVRPRPDLPCRDRALLLPEAGLMRPRRPEAGSCALRDSPVLARCVRSSSTCGAGSERGRPDRAGAAPGGAPGGPPARWRRRVHLALAQRLARAPVRPLRTLLPDRGQRRGHARPGHLHRRGPQPGAPRSRAPCFGAPLQASSAWSVHVERPQTLCCSVRRDPAHTPRTPSPKRPHAGARRRTARSCA